MNVTSFLILIIGLFFFQSVFFILRKIIKNKLYKGIVVTNPLIRIKKNENSGVNEGLVDYQWTIIISFIFLIGTLLIFLIVLNFGSGSTLVLDIFLLLVVLFLVVLFIIFNNLKLFIEQNDEND